MTTISLCMIVKDEEPVLQRCLDSLRGLMDEIIIVDTGSSDRTKEIALQYTDQVYDYQWENDFAKARNYAASFATCDYIYTADADEVLDEENREKFRQLKQVLLPEIEVVQMLYSGQYNENTIYNFDEEYRPKLYKRVRAMEFYSPIHETLRFDPVVYESDIRIFHKPHGMHSDRDFRVFEQHYGKDSNLCIPSRLLGLYAKELYISGNEEQFVRAIPVCEKVLAKDNCSQDDLQYAACILAHASRVQGDVSQFFKYAMKVVLTEECSEICMELGEHYETIGDLEEAHIWYYNAAYETQPVCNIRMGKEIPIRKLAEVADKAGLPDVANEYRKQLDGKSI